MRSVIVFAALALAAAAVVPHFAERASVSRPPAALAAQPTQPAQPSTSNSRSVVVPRDGDGHFRVDGRVDGRRLSFMVDTGASVIALNERDAATLGIHPAQRELARRCAPRTAR